MHARVEILQGVGKNAARDGDATRCRLPCRRRPQSCETSSALLAGLPRLPRLTSHARIVHQRIDRLRMPARDQIFGLAQLVRLKLGPNLLATSRRLLVARLSNQRHPLVGLLQIPPYAGAVFIKDREVELAIRETALGGL